MHLRPDRHNMECCSQELPALVQLQNVPLLTLVMRSTDQSGSSVKMKTWIADQAGRQGVQ